MEGQLDPKALLAELSLPPENATKAWFQERGRQLERLIESVLKNSGLEPRIRIRPNGEEIDGSFALDGRYYLLEAKWHAGPTPASHLYAFKGKVDGKLAGTIGVFITMGRYSPDAVTALQAGKVVNLVLFSAEDFRLVVDGGCSFAQAMRRKLRHATEEGSPFLPLEPIAENTLGAGRSPISRPPPGVINFETVSRPSKQPAEEWNLVVEGRSDEAGISALFDGLLATHPIQLRYWVAEGAANVPSLVRGLTASSRLGRIVVFVDGDVAGQRVAREISELGVDVIIMDPDLEYWLTPATPTDWYNAAPPTGIREKELRRLARHADVGQLRSSNPAFDELLRHMKLRASSR